VCCHAEPARRSPETRLESLTPSAKFVYTVLEYEGPLTQKALAEQTRLSQRSVRSALADLGDVDLVEERVYPEDARQRLYAVAERAREG
jgi:DNA-binding MarR family transcriptional regulator